MLPIALSGIVNASIFPHFKQGITKAASHSDVINHY
jgi:hypothetical protein